MTPIAVSTLTIIIVVLGVLIAAFATGGYIAATRRQQAREGDLRRELAQVERELAAAHASDKGWDPALLATAARDAAVERFGDAAIGDPQLIQVVDRPGTDADQAVFRVKTADGAEHRLTLGRTGGEWGLA